MSGMSLSKVSPDGDAKGRGEAGPGQRGETKVQEKFGYALSHLHTSEETDSGG